MLPLWYIPADQPAPTHLLPGPEVAVLRGPDQGPGRVRGGPYQPTCQPGWQRLPSGRWLHAHCLTPSAFLRLDPDPALIHHETVSGAHPGHIWSIPVLLHGSEEAGWKSALDRTWRGRDAWAVSPLLADLQTDLLRVAAGVPIATDPDLNAQALIHLATRVLGLVYHLTDDELAALGWISESLVLRIIVAALGQRPPMGDPA
jgi:hypothetical protein